MPSILLYTRPGFERDCAAEAMYHAENAGLSGYVNAKPDSGWLQFCSEDASGVREFVRHFDFSLWVFARQWFEVRGHVEDLPVGDRVAPLLAALGGATVSDVWVEYPDTNEGKALSKLARGLEGHLRRSLEKSGQLRSVSPLRAHVLLISGAEAWVGTAPIENSAPWPLGYPRLRMPKAAPSRSTLKLEEAFHVLLGRRSDALPRPNQRAVDLGAAPGGWTWQLIQRGVKVIAVDNGPLAPQVMEEGRVLHLREDAFAFKPQQPVDWMVCDVVETPARVAALMERWLVRGWCKTVIFNLKLPMKRRWQEVQQILEGLEKVLEAAGLRYELRAHQLYHDREEITVWITVDPAIVGRTSAG
ncbi:Predicted SAM-dependent methyltransferase [gamma proteobacterium HdN1]|nr:Predicted SAM-dependent methyltransferase [gamma proteobacterium HdN1]